MSPAAQSCHISFTKEQINFNALLFTIAAKRFSCNNLADIIQMSQPGLKNLTTFDALMIVKLVLTFCPYAVTFLQEA